MATYWLTYSASASDDLLAYPVLTVMLIIHQLCIINLSEYQWKHSQIVKAALAVILQYYCYKSNPSDVAMLLP